MHRVEPVALGGGDENSARAIVLDDRVTRILFPVDEVFGAGEVGRPVFPWALGVGVVKRVVIAVALDNLVERHGCRVVGLGSSGDDGIILDVGPGFEVARIRQTEPLISSIVKEVTDAVLKPGGRRTVGAWWYRSAVGLANLERT